MYIYLIIAGALAIFLTIIILCYRISTLKMQLRFNVSNNEELAAQNQFLLGEKISFVQKIEQLSTKIEYLNQIISEAEKNRHQAHESAKAALFDLGGELSKQLIEIHKRENKESRELSEKNIAVSAERFNSEFERIVNMIGGLSKDIEQSKGTVDLIKQSLLSPTGAGKLAEITLENILKSSGLRSSLDYVMQYNLVTAENAKLRPDAIIFLPGGNLMVIDAKASKFLTENITAQENLARTMNSHLKSLSSKEYAENALATFQNKGENFYNQITLMFLPTEQAVEKIIEADHTFLHRAWSANIFPVGPSGLMNMLSFAKFQISDNMRSENHKLIIEEVRKLLSSVSIIADHSQKLGNNIQSMVANYDKFAGSFNRSFLSKAKNIEKLGINAGNKHLPQALERYQLVSMKSEVIESDPIEEAKQLEEA